MKRSLTTVDLIAIVRELKPLLVNGYVDNIYVYDDSVIFRMENRGNKLYLVANSHRFSLIYRLPQYTYRGAETLRGLLRDEKVLGIELPRFDRIVRIDIGRYAMFVELLEPFNIVIVEGGRTVWSLRRYRGKDRLVVGGREYSLPPQNFADPLSATPEHVDELIKRYGNPVRALARGLGLGGEVANEVAARCPSCGPEELLRTARHMIVGVRDGPLTPTEYLEGGKPLSVVPMEYVHLEAKALEKVRHDTFNRAVDEYFQKLEVYEDVEKRVHEVEQERRRVEAAIRDIEEKIAEYSVAAMELREAARQLLMDRERLAHVLEDIYRLLRSGGGSRTAGLEVGGIKVLGVDYVKRLVEVDMGGVKATLRIGEPVGAAIKRLFEEAKTYEEKARKARDTLSTLRERLRRVEEEAVRKAEEARASRRRAAQKEWFEKYRWTVTSFGTPLLGGRDASQNEALVRKHLRDEYLFFHADVPGAAAVVAPPINEPLDIYEAAQFAAAYSRAWKVGIHSVDVFYARGEQVSKSPPPGQYLPRGSFMVYGKREWVRNVRLELGIGVRRDEDAERIVVAPPRSIGMLAEIYVVVVPGNKERGDAAKELLKALRARVPLDEVVQALPGPLRLAGMDRGNPRSWDEVRSLFARL